MTGDEVAITVTIALLIVGVVVGIIASGSMRE